jgi:hypothetical protein
VHRPFDLEAFLRYVWERWNDLIRECRACRHVTMAGVSAAVRLHPWRAPADGQAPGPAVHPGLPSSELSPRLPPTTYAGALTSCLRSLIGQGRAPLSLLQVGGPQAMNPKASNRRPNKAAVALPPEPTSSRLAC